MQTASADYTWANTNVFGATPTSPRDWFPGGPNTQGTWIGGAPVSFQGYAAQTVFFQDNTTPLGNTGASGNVQTVNLNSNGVPFQLRLLVLSGKSSDTPGANLDMTLSGDPLWFSNLTSPVGGTIQVRGVNNVQTLLSYDVKNPIIIGNTGSGGKGTLVVLGAGSAGLNLSGDISELQAGGRQDQQARIRHHGDAFGQQRHLRRTRGAGRHDRIVGIKHERYEQCVHQNRNHGVRPRRGQ